VSERRTSISTSPSKTGGGGFACDPADSSPSVTTAAQCGAGPGAPPARVVPTREQAASGMKTHRIRAHGPAEHAMSYEHGLSQQTVQRRDPDQCPACLSGGCLQRRALEGLQKGRLGDAICQHSTRQQNCTHERGAGWRCIDTCRRRTAALRAEPELTRRDGEDLLGGHLTAVAHGDVNAAPCQLRLRRPCGQPVIFMEAVQTVLCRHR